MPQFVTLRVTAESRESVEQALDLIEKVGVFGAFKRSEIKLGQRGEWLGYATVLLEGKP